VRESAQRGRGEKESPDSRGRRGVSATGSSDTLRTPPVLIRGEAASTLLNQEMGKPSRRPEVGGRKEQASLYRINQSINQSNKSWG
jgi:hypothetical protein